jgi:cytochrome c5
MTRNVPALLVLAALACSPAAAYDQAAAEKLFQKHCTTCHPADRSLKKNKDQAGWEKTVARMQRYASGLFGDGDAGTIVQYLTSVRGPEN